MSDFFDELERRLRDAAAERGAAAGPADETPAAAELRRAPRRSWPRRHRGLLIAAAAALAGLAVPAVAAVTDLWRPDVKPPPRMATVTASSGHGHGHAVSCSGMSSSRIDVGPPVGPEFTSVLGVLARPRTSADDFPRRYLRAPGFVGVDVQGIRYLGTAPDGVRYFAVPVRGVGFHPLPARCLRKLTPRLRRRFQLQLPPPAPTVCVYGGGGGGCSSVADIRAHGTFGSSGTMDTRSTVAGVVPNGVRAVRVTYGRSTRTFPVHDNFFSFQVALGTVRAMDTDRVEWLMENGGVRDVTRHPPPLIRQSGTPAP